MAGGLAAKSLAISGGRSNEDVGAMFRRGPEYVLGLSLLKAMASNRPLSLACLMVWASSGHRPAMRRRFLPGTPLEPPRAPIVQIRFTVPEHSREFQACALKVVHVTDVEPVLVNGEAVHPSAICDGPLNQRRHVEMFTRFVMRSSSEGSIT